MNTPGIGQPVKPAPRGVTVQGWWASSTLRLAWLYTLAWYFAALGFGEPGANLRELRKVESKPGSGLVVVITWVVVVIVVAWRWV